MQGFIKLTSDKGELYVNTDHIITFYDYDPGSIVYLSHPVEDGRNFILVSEEMEYINNLISASPID